ncbi:MAG: UPF0758 domain-containing protein [Candidatus Pacearchaeota archaeon]
MKIKDLPEQNRPRERFLKHGKEALSDAELMAIILRTGTAKENVMEVSNKLISKFGLTFRINGDSVYLISIDHRKSAYY